MQKLKGGPQSCFVCYVLNNQFQNILFISRMAHGGKPRIAAAQDSIRRGIPDHRGFHTADFSVWCHRLPGHGLPGCQLLLPQALQVMGRWPLLWKMAQEKWKRQNSLNLLGLYNDFQGDCFLQYLPPSPKGQSRFPHQNLLFSCLHLVIWWLKHFSVYATATVTFSVKLFKDFILFQCITFIKRYQNLFLTRAVAVGKFLDISLSRVQVLTSQISSGLSLNTTARYCLKQMRIYSSKSHLSILLHLCCSQQHSGDPQKLQVSRANQIPLWSLWFPWVTEEQKNVWKRVLLKANRIINFYQVVLPNYCGGDKGNSSERAAAPLISPCLAWWHKIPDGTKYQKNTQDCRLDRDFSLLQMHASSQSQDKWA